MRGTERTARGGREIPGPAGAGWIVNTVADFNLDGMEDILWSNGVTGSMAVWLMRGTEVLEAGPEIPGPRGGGWELTTAADFDGDGMADVLWNAHGHDEPHRRVG